ncbi:hypothetical protein HP467_16965 [Curtobacterium albidum]|uniref:Uncharacterized protein n=1 Tax=Curtobacterium citreum TaxID=2036 RepID=A0A850E2D6_9MICO|nr:hypothetical protein [Curtobacterium albidum]NUU29783.1 hypothetical protein [Curtobacterium albidum]
MNKIRTVGIVGAIVTGAMLSTVGATAASAQPVHASSVSAVASSAPAASLPMPRHGGVIASSGGSSTDGIPIKPIVDWLKNNASSVIPALKTALKNGLNAFKNWWNGLAGWIRAGINAIAQMSIQEMFSALWNYFFG